MDSTSTRRLTRSQTSATVLGKRTPGLLRTSSMSSINSAMSINTPESTPTKKRARTTHEKYDPRANKENIPPNDLFQPPSFIPYLLTPPPTPPVVAPLHVRVRSQLRATSNSGIAMSMEGRGNERAVIESFLYNFGSAAEITYSILYISGGPGTGKTALVNSMIASSKLNDGVKVIFINCMAITGMDALWARLADELSGVVSKGRGRRPGKKLQGKDEVYAILEKRNNLKCILVLDELDNLAGACSSALRLIFGLASTFSSSIRIMGIANTHTLMLNLNVNPSSSDELDSSKSSSPIMSNAKPLNIKTIHFAPYTPDELLSILEKRLEEFDQDELRQLLPRPTLVLLTKKVAALTGDVRVLFEVLRGAIDLALPVTPDSSSLLSNPTVEDIPRASVSPSHILSSLKSHAPVSTAKDKSAVSANNSNIPSSSNSETVSKVRNLGLQARLVILALVLASKRVTTNLPLSSSVPSTPTKRPSSPSKRSPLKRAASSSPVLTQSNAPAASAGIDSSVLFTYYTSLLASTETFSPVSRSDFTDLLGVLETMGFVSLAAASAATSGSSVRRTASVPSMFSSARAKAGAQGAQRISLQAHVREGEIERGLGVAAAGDSATKSNEEADVMKSEVRTIWMREMARMRREVKAKDKDALAAFEGVLGFDNANED